MIKRTQINYRRFAMDVLEIRRLLKTKSVFDIPLCVTYYARVSTDTEEQINSLDLKLTDRINNLLKAFDKFKQQTENDIKQLQGKPIEIQDNNNNNNTINNTNNSIN